MKELAFLNKYLLKYKYQLLTGILFIILKNVFTIILPPIVSRVLNQVTETLSKYNNLIINNPKEAETLKNQFTQDLILNCIIIIASAVISGIFLYYHRKILIGMSRHIEYDLKNEIYVHYQSLPSSFYKKNNTGDLMNRISEDVSRVRDYLGPAIMYILNLIILFMIVIPAMWMESKILTLYAIIPLPLMALTIYLVHNMITKKSEDIQKSLSGLSTIVQEKFAGIRVVKSFVREDDSVRVFEEESNVYKNKSLDLGKINAFFFPIILTMVGAGVILTIYIGGKEAIAGNISYGTIAEFIIYLQMLAWPVASLGWTTSLIKRAEASQGRINQFLKTSSSLISGEQNPNDIKGEIEFRNVSFTYPDTGIQAIKNISFKVSANETLAIVGNTGSGKSTIANLLCRLYDPTSGSIIVDGVNIKEYNTQQYRNNIGYVPQDVFLFSDTISNNVAFGANSSIQQEEIIKATKNADLYDNIQNFPLGFETIIGERGITLSGGQKQRLSIARAISRNPSILIMDDCLSAVDTKTEDTILSNMRDVMKNRTSIIISHRISSVKLAHKILFLDNGILVEEGTHEELIKKNGQYKELYNRQLEEDIENIRE